MMNSAELVFASASLSRAKVTDPRRLHLRFDKKNGPVGGPFFPQQKEQ
jgi:hypothetical protein